MHSHLFDINMKKKLSVAFVLLASMLLSGCLPAVGFDRGAAGPDDIVLTAVSHLSVDGDEVQAVTLEAAGWLPEDFTLVTVKIFGLIGEEHVVDVQPVSVTETSSGAGGRQAIVRLNVSELMAAGVTKVQFVVGGAQAIIDVPAPADEPSPGGDPTSGEEPTPGEDPGEEPGQQPQPEPGEEPPASQPGQANSREVRTLRAGTADATNVYVIRADEPGPTVMIVGGVHGDETSGWLAGREIKDWEIDAGTLIVLPEAHKQAVSRQRRTSAAGVDLNRQFPLRSTPTNSLAREIWDVVLEFRPDALLDMHEGWGIYGRHDSVGQTLITYSAGDAQAFARHATSYLNTHHVSNQNMYRFRIVGPPVEGSLARKAGDNLGIPAFIAEATAYQTKQETRVRWQKAFAEEMLRWYGLLTRPERYVPQQYRVQAQVVPSVAVAAAA